MGLILLNCITANAASVTGFNSGYWWQAAGYAGLGNQNEMLAFGEYLVPKGQHEVTVKFKLQGKYAIFLDRVCLYACKYDPQSTSNSSDIAKTFERLWDYRDPFTKVGAVLLSQSYKITGDEYTMKGAELDDSTQYVFFVTGDIKDNIDELPLIGGKQANYTRIGAKITEISSGDDKATLTQKFVGSSGKNNDEGERVLVPQLKTMFSPGDYYSKYYRIPAIVTAADGSLVTVSDARKQHIHDITNDIDMVSRYSEDDGHTWSSPVTIAKGDSATKTMSGGINIIDCTNSTGFGDAAFASLPYGDLLCSFIHGYGLNSSSESQLSNNSYVISRDNGHTWGTIKDMCDKNGNKLVLLTKYRGNIAPGNMCVVKSGHLAGKVIACFRSFKTVTGSFHKGNYFVTYDPDGDYWNILSVNTTVAYNSSDYTDDNFFYTNKSKGTNGDDDEAQLIEIGENTFLMSIRSTASGKSREFAIITVAKSGDIVYVNTTPLNNCGMTLSEPANGAMCKYTAAIDGTETEYLIHTVPATKATNKGGTGARSALSIYTAKTSDVSASGFTWSKGLCISDPDDALDETAQYSSITVQRDGSIGIFFEDYPQIIRVNPECFGTINGDKICGATGDFLLRSQYMNLRIGDIIPGATHPEHEPLLPPIITPASQTYDVDKPSTWGDITIKNINPAGVSETRYQIQVYDAKEKLVQTIVGDDFKFDGDSIVLKWTDGKLPQDTITLMAGYSIRVEARCFVKEGYEDTYDSPSTVPSQIYYFKHPTHKVRIVAMPEANFGAPTISITGSSVGENTWLTVGEGEAITLFAGYLDPFEFVSFSSSSDESQKSSIDAKFSPTRITSSQYTVTIPSGYEGGDEITFYAWYKSPEIGVKTRVNTNYYNSNADDIIMVDGKTSLVHKYKFTDWCSNPEYENVYNWDDCEQGAGVGKPQFPAFVPDGTDLCELKFADGDIEDISVGSELYYPAGSDDNTSYRKYGLDLTARIMSDTTTYKKYNAIVMVKRDGTFMTTSDFVEIASNANATMAKARLRATSHYYYYVVNGFRYPFAETSDIAANAQNIMQWYSLDGDDEAAILPEVSDAMTFNNVIDKNSSDKPNYNVVFFVVNKNNLSSIQELVDGNSYVFKVEHPVVPNASMTGIDAAKTASGLIITGKHKCATFTSGKEQSVSVYNMLGQQVATFNLCDSHTIALEQGVYVANGQKFIVR